MLHVLVGSTGYSTVCDGSIAVFLLYPSIHGRVTATCPESIPLLAGLALRPSQNELDSAKFFSPGPISIASEGFGFPLSPAKL